MYTLYFSALVQRAKGNATKGKRSTASAAAGSASQLDCVDTNKSVSDFINSASLIRSDDNCEDSLVMDSEVIPPTMKNYTLSWTEGNLETISVTSTLSDGKLCFY